MSVGQPLQLVVVKCDMSIINESKDATAAGEGLGMVT